MSLLRMLGLVDEQATAKTKVHDFRFDIAGQRLSLLKHLDGNRIFFVADKRVARGDVVIVKPPRGAKGPTRFRVDNTQATAAGWRAYGTACP